MLQLLARMTTPRLQPRCQTDRAPTSLVLCSRSVCQTLLFPSVCRIKRWCSVPFDGQRLIYLVLFACNYGLVTKKDTDCDPGVRGLMKDMFIFSKVEEKIEKNINYFR